MQSNASKTVNSDKSNVLNMTIAHQHMQERGRDKKHLLNPSKPNGISHSYQLDQYISVLRAVGWYFFIFIKILIELSQSKQWRP